MGRLTSDEYFVLMSLLVSLRSTCLRRIAGAVVVMNKKILGTGYNGVPSGLAHCLDIGCLRSKEGIPSGERRERCRGLHAEDNAIRQALPRSSALTSLEGAELFCTDYPCGDCTKKIITERISRVVFLGDYPDDLGKEMFEEAKGKVRVEKWRDENASELFLFLKPALYQATERLMERR